MARSKDGGGVVVNFPGGKSPDAADRYVGARIRERRIMLGMSQEKLAAMLGVSFQQIQKYERGHNRVGAGRLLAIATALGVEISFFFEGYATRKSKTENREETASDLQLLLTTRDGMALAQAFVKIENKTMRQALVTMAQAAAKEES